MKRITVGLYALNYQDSRGVYISAGDAITDGKKLYRAVQSKDKKYLGLEKDDKGNVTGFTEDSLPHLRKVLLTKNEEKNWKLIGYKPVSREELAS